MTLRISTSWSTIGGSSRRGTIMGTMICSTECRWTRSCGLTSIRRSGRVPLAASGSLSRKKCCTPAAWGVDSSEAWPCTSSRSDSPAPAVIWRCALWCVNVARAWAIDCCSCHQAARSRRPLRPWAAPVLGCQHRSIRKGDATKQWGRLSQTRCCFVVLLRCCGVVVFWCCGVVVVVVVVCVVCASGVCGVSGVSGACGVYVCTACDQTCGLLRCQSHSGPSSL